VESGVAEQLKRLLVISWCMPPLLYPRSIQVSRTLAGLSRLGWESTVVCCDPSSPYPGNVIDPTLGAASKGCFNYLPVSPNENISPDYLASSWLKPAFEACKQEISKRSFSGLITFAQPWVDHLVGLEIHRLFKIPWLAHFSDPWVDSPYYNSVKASTMKQWRGMEREIIITADGVLFTNSHAEELIMAKYPPSWKDKVASIPHCYDQSQLPEINDSPKNKRMQLVYTGDLYGPRNPDGLLKALNIMNSDNKLSEVIEVTIVGNSQEEHHQQVNDLGLESIVQFQKKLPYLKSLEFASRADVLLLIDAPNQGTSPFLPSKLVDYLMYNRPILGLTPAYGASAELLQKLGCKVVSPDDIHGIVTSLQDLLKVWQEGKLAISKDFISAASLYDLNETSKLFEQAIDRAIQKSNLPKPLWKKLFQK
jgi:hypothetical protein